MHPDDQLMLRARLDQRAEFYPLGFPLQIATNSPDILSAAEQTWGSRTQAFDRPPLEMRVIVHLDGPVPPAEPVYRAQKHLLTFTGDNANFAVCDLERGYIFSCVTPATAASGYFRAHLLETIAYLALDYLHVTILHAGCVARNGRGVLLCGDPGAGKSCLCYACATNGWKLVSDDFTAILRKPRGRMVIGRPQRMRFRSTAFELFPELVGQRSEFTQFGKHMFELYTGSLPQVQTADCCQAETIVFLDRQDSCSPELVPMPVEQALARFEFDRFYWDPPIFEEQRERIMDLLARGVHTLRYSNFDDAIRILESLV